MPAPYRRDDSDSESESDAIEFEMRDRVVEEVDGSDESSDDEEDYEEDYNPSNFFYQHGVGRVTFSNGEQRREEVIVKRSKYTGRMHDFTVKRDLGGLIEPIDIVVTELGAEIDDNEWEAMDQRQAADEHPDDTDSEGEFDDQD